MARLFIQPKFVLFLYMDKNQLSIREMAEKCRIAYRTIWRALKNNVVSSYTAQKIEDGTKKEILFEQLTTSSRTALYRKRLKKRESLAANK